MNRWLHRLAARVVRYGRLEVTWSDGSVSHYGEDDGPSARLHFHEPSAEWAVLRNPEVALGEAYMDGRIDFPGGTLLEFLLLLNKNWTEVTHIASLSFLSKVRYATRGLTQNNSMLRARRHIARHYDLDERIYRLFLDSDMQYSCAYFERPDVELEEAQWAKKRHIASKLDLKPGQSVLDIGSGWGGLGLFLGEYFGVNVTGVTLSAEQHRVSTQRALERGLERRVRFELRDYRALDRTFDRIVSVGMFEHIGAARYEEFFRTAANLLTPDGVMLLHSIGRSEPPGGTNPFIAKYIFPGGYIPAMSEVMKAVERVPPVRQRHGDPSPSLRRDAEGVARSLHGAAGRGGGDLRRALLPHVGILPGRIGGRLPRRRHDGFSASASQEPDDLADHPRLHGRGRKRLPRRAGRARIASAGRRVESARNQATLRGAA